jgi:hypothetical protein
MEVRLQAKTREKYYGWCVTVPYCVVLAELEREMIAITQRSSFILKPYLLVDNGDKCTSGTPSDGILLGTDLTEHQRGKESGISPQKMVRGSRFSGARARSSGNLPKNTNKRRTLLKIPLVTCCVVTIRLKGWQRRTMRLRF